VALSIAQAAGQLDLLRAQPLRLAGGGTLDPWWQQLLADALNRPLPPARVWMIDKLGEAGRL
jgi:sugar (pentulose or hexulose) kinase